MTAPRALTVVPERRAELETCAYCPKLCRAACPVSNAEARDTVTPWGKMSGTHAVATDLAPVDADYAALAWACTGCFACRERCDHQNPVRETLYEARADYLRLGVAPEASERVRLGFGERQKRIDDKTQALATKYALDARAPTALLIGCTYVDRLPAEAEDALLAARALFGPLRLAFGCCGAPLEAAGDAEGAARARRELLKSMAGCRRRLVVDAGCAHALRGAPVELFVRAAAAASNSVPVRRNFGDEPLRYHDSCLLGRGLGEYAAPRALVARASTRGVAEFSYRREQARCSGGGGLVPSTQADTAKEIARTRVAEHERLGGGTIVTACAQSARMLRGAGARVLDLGTLVRRLFEP